MSSLTKFEQEAFQLNDQTINRIKNLLQNRSSRTDKSIVNDFEKMMIQYRDAKNKLLEHQSNQERRIEDYFWSRNIEVYDRVNKGTCTEYRTSEGRFTETAEGDLYKGVMHVMDRKRN